MKWLVEEWQKLEGVNLRLTALLVCFFVFGSVGINHPFTRQVFEPLSGFTLFYALIALLLTHQHFNRRLLQVLVFAFCVGMGVEIAGVATGAIFGNYQYTNMLGWQLFSVPVIIGVNWVSLTYATNNVAARFLKSKFFAALAAALAMTAFDVLIEPLAIRHHFWVWTDNGFPPFQNFVAWFVVSMILSFVYQFTVPRRFNFSALVFVLALSFFLWVDFCVSYFEQQF